MVMNLPASAGAPGDVGSIPGSGRPPGEGNGNPLQYSGKYSKPHGQRSLVGCSPWGHKDSNTTEQMNTMLTLAILFVISIKNV